MGGRLGRIAVLGVTALVLGLIAAPGARRRQQPSTAWTW
jgi:hypothetical protein